MKPLRFKQKTLTSLSPCKIAVVAPHGGPSCQCQDACIDLFQIYFYLRNNNAFLSNILAESFHKHLTLEQLLIKAKVRDLSLILKQ